MTFEVELEQFSGPLQLLLELIYQEKLPITEVSLSQVTDAYLQHIDAHDVAPEELADFLVIATKLLHLKSKTLLPLLRPEEDEEEVSSLIDQLRLYEMFVEAAKMIDQQSRLNKAMYVRGRMIVKKSEGFFPPTDLKPEGLKEVYKRLLKRLEPFARLKRASMERLVSVKERVAQMRTVILERTRMSFREVISGANKTDTVVSFLALLELLRERSVSVSQSEAFEDIVIKHVK